MAVAFAAAPVPLSDPEIVNSGRGEYLWLAQPKDPAWWPDLIDEYARDAIAWKTVEPSQGVYDFTVIEQRLAAAAARGGRFGFRVMPMLGIDETRQPGCPAGTTSVSERSIPAAIWLRCGWPRPAVTPPVHTSSGPPTSMGDAP